MAERTARSTPLDRGTRIAPLVGLAGGTSGETVAMALRRRAAAAPAATAEDHRARLSRSRAVAVRAAALLWSAATGSVMPPEAVAAVIAASPELADDPPTTPAALTAETIRAELGRPVEELFPVFDPQPHATDALVQVHAATMPDGRPVAVEVLHHGVGQILRTLLAGPQLYAALAPLLSAAGPAGTAAGLSATAGELRGRVEQLIGLRGRAVVLSELAAAHRDHPLVRVPGVVAELSARRVLTRDRVAGATLAEAARGDVTDRERWGGTVFRFATHGAAGLGLVVIGPDGADLRFHDGGVVSVLGTSVPRRFTPDEVAARSARARAVIAGDGAALVALYASHCATGPGAALPSPETLLAWHRRVLGPLGGRPTRAGESWILDAHRAVLPGQRPCTGAPPGRRDCVFGTELDTALATVLGTLHVGAHRIALHGAEAGTPVVPPTETRERVRPAERKETPDVG